MSDLVRPGASPFDAIRHVDERGEHWFARELMRLHGYDKWQNYIHAIEQAMIAAKVSGVDVTSNFTAISKVSDGPGPNGADYRLSRYACYLIAMRGDSRKRQIAEALTYFAVKTREAEVVQQQIPRTYAEALRAAADQSERAALAEAKAAEQGKELELARPKAAYVDAFINPGEDVTTIGDFAKELGIRMKDLREYLVARKRIYKRVLPRRWSASKQREQIEYEWRYHAGFETWFTLREQPDAPRLHNGQIRMTLYVTPVGKERIRRMLETDPIGGAA